MSADIRDMNTNRLRKLVKDLSSDDDSVRKAAAEALAEADERALYPLIKALRDRSPGVQDAAMRSLISIGGEVTAYMVIPLLRENAFLRNTALIILKEIGNTELLEGLLRDKDDDVRKFAIDLFMDIGDTAACRLVGSMLEDPNANVRAAAAKAIGVLGCEELVPLLSRAMKDEEWVCFAALEAAAMIKSPALLEPISELLASPSDAVRFATIESLGKIGTPEAGAVLKEFIKKAEGIEKNTALKSLIEIGLTPEMKDLAESLLSMLKSGDRDDILIALRGIASIGCAQAVPIITDMGGALDPLDPEDSEMIEAYREALLKIGSSEQLIEVIKSEKARYRGKVLAIETLGRMRSRDAIPPLIELLESPVRDIRRAGARALGEIGHEDAIPHLLSSTDDPDGHVRKAAVVALGRLRAASAFNPIMELIATEPYSDVKEEMVRALLRIDGERFMKGIRGYTEEVREMTARFTDNENILVELAEDDSSSVRVSAVLGLGRLATAKAREKIRKASRDPDPEVRKAAAQCIGDLRCCRPELERLLSDDNMWVRFYAVKAVASLGNGATVDLIRPVLDDPEITVIMGAIEALSAMESPEALAALESLREHPDPAVQERVSEVMNTLW